MDEFDQIGISQQSFLKHILQKPVVNTRRPNASAVEELRRYASFIGTSNHKDLLTDTSGSRRFIGVEVTGVIDVVRLLIMSSYMHRQWLHCGVMSAIGLMKKRRRL